MKLIAVALFVFCSSANAASFYTGNDLLRFMQSGELTDRVLALGYVMGRLIWATGRIFVLQLHKSQEVRHETL